MTINKNSFRGKTARQVGEFFETLVEYSCARYKQAGIADIQKTPEPMKILKPINRSRGTFEAVFAKQAQPDFKGVLDGGRMIMFEAKRTKTTSIAKSRISDEQAINFNSATELGAECFVLVSFSEQSYFKVPWMHWRNMEMVFKKKSVNQDDLEAYEVFFTQGMIDFLDAFKEGDSNNG